MHDPSTIMAILRPDLFTLHIVDWVHVECQSLVLRGTTITEFRRFAFGDQLRLATPRNFPHAPPSLPRNCTIYLACDADAILQVYTERIASYSVE
jgi:inosine-uridine nucleoside N-ribohydrolase